MGVGYWIFPSASSMNQLKINKKWWVVQSYSASALYIDRQAFFNLDITDMTIETGSVSINVLLT